MSDATKAMRDFLTKSPSVVFPDEVLELFIPVERENERLREQADFEHFQLGDMKRAAGMMLDEFDALVTENERLRELVSVIWMTARLMDANKRIEGMRITDDFRAECERAFDELGIKVR